MELTGLLFYLVSVLIAGGIYAILCLALNIQWGMGGLFNAGIAGFFAVGAYTSAIVTTATLARARSMPKRIARAGPRPSVLWVGITRGSELAYFSRWGTVVSAGSS